MEGARPQSADEPVANDPQAALPVFAVSLTSLTLGTGLRRWRNPGAQFAVEGGGVGPQFSERVSKSDDYRSSIPGNGNLRPETFGRKRRERLIEAAERPAQTESRVDKPRICRVIPYGRKSCQSGATGWWRKGGSKRPPLDATGERISIEGDALRINFTAITNDS
jgi:hypothetical protein